MSPAETPIRCNRCGQEVPFWKASWEGWNISIDPKRGLNDVCCKACKNGGPR